MENTMTYHRVRTYEPGSPAVMRYENLAARKITGPVILIP